MIARLSTGEVSLTASIDQVVLEFFLAVVARHATLAKGARELSSCHACQLMGFAEWQNLLSIKCYCEFKQETFLHAFLG